MIPSNNGQQHCRKGPAIQSERLLKHETDRVKAAISEDRLTLFFQPVARSDNPGFIAFYEGLARIDMPDGRVIPAGQFIPFVEDTPVGRILDRKTLELALLALHKNSGLRLSVNLSPLSISDKGWLDVFDTYAKGVGDRLILEITESAVLADIEQTEAFLKYVRTFGCSVAMDDFGAGYTSFRHLRDFHFDIVKIDGSFIRGLPYNKDNQILVEALLKIARHFDIMTIAEFVETDGEARKATDMGVDGLQGYLIGKATRTPEKPGVIEQLAI